MNVSAIDQSDEDTWPDRQKDDDEGNDRIL